MTLHPSVAHQKSVNSYNSLERRFIEMHGNKYDYSESVYISAKTPIKIWCNACSEFFEQVTDSHVSGKGCPTCGFRASRKSMDTLRTEFIDKANLVHNHKYDYSKVVYVNNNTKVQIICPLHGESEMTPAAHLKYNGCAERGKLQFIKTRTDSLETFIAKANKVHNNRYTYLKADYKSSKVNVIITCKIHGNFEQGPYQHLQGQGCPTCGREIIANARRLDTEQFITKANAVHGVGTYDYSKVNYTTQNKQVEIICKFHGSFMQLANTHLQGHSCPGCCRQGYDKTKPGSLYYLEVETSTGEMLYKIGITNRTVKKRYSKIDRDKITMLFTKYFDNGADALRWETLILRAYKEHKYFGDSILESGNSELFTIDILGVKEMLNLKEYKS